MTLETFYLICFIAGFIFTAVSFLSGTMHLHLHFPGHGHFHLGGHGAGGHGAHGGAAGAPAAPGAHAAQSAASGAPGARTTHGGDHFPFINPMTIAVFLAW